MEPSARIDCSITPGFAAWMEQCGGVVAVSTYQAGKVGMFGWDGRQVTLIMREFDKPLGIGLRVGPPGHSDATSHLATGRRAIARAALLARAAGPLRRAVFAARRLLHR